MKLLIEVPTWLGDAVMSTPAIENLLKYFNNAEITIVGSFVSTQLFINYPSVVDVVIDNTKKSKNRYWALYRLAKSLGKFDFAVSFRSSFTSKLFLFFLNCKETYNYKKIKEEKHQVLKYNHFINIILNRDYKAGDLKIYFDPIKYEKLTMGINPGSTYGSAKRWYPNEFAKVAIEMSKTHNIVIFGGPGEIDIANDIEVILKENGIENYINIAGKTTIPELIEKIAGLDYFVTNDSGPMHVAGVFKVPTVTIFGPTKFTETNQWNNPNSVIVTKNLECSPCMKRTCPLKHHNCMKLILAEDVLKEIK